MNKEDRTIILRRANENLEESIRNHAAKYGWHNTAKAFRGAVFVYVGWDSDFTELDNVLRKIEKNFEEASTKNVDRACRARRSDIPNLPDGDPADHFS